MNTVKIKRPGDLASAEMKEAPDGDFLWTLRYTNGTIIKIYIPSDGIVNIVFNRDYSINEKNEVEIIQPLGF